MNLKVALAEETISQEELNDASDWMRQGNKLTKGEQTSAFERQFAEYLGVQHAIFVNSGSSANLLVAAALKESGKLRNMKVVCPAVSWVTTVSPFIQLGFEVILCDADAINLGVDVVHLREIFEKEAPSALAIVHVLGHSNHQKQVLDLCAEFDVLLFEDTCEALGSRVSENKFLGTDGVASSFSFYYGHHISTIEGGMVATNDFDLYQTMLSLRSHGWSRDLDIEVRAALQAEHKIDDFRNLYTFYSAGFNFRSTDLQAFIGRGQLPKMKDIARVRAANFNQYSTRLEGFWQQSSKLFQLSSFAFGTAVRNRREVASVLAESGIESRPLICGNIARHPFWQKYHPVPNLQVADFVHEHGLYLPNHARLSLEQVDKVADVFLGVARPINP